MVYSLVAPPPNRIIRSPFTSSARWLDPVVIGVHTSQPNTQICFKLMFKEKFESLTFEFYRHSYSMRAHISSTNRCGRFYKSRQGARFNSCSTLFFYCFYYFLLFHSFSFRFYFSHEFIMYRIKAHLKCKSRASPYTPMSWMDSEKKVTDKKA